MRPVNNYLIVQKIKENTKLAGGFELTEGLNPDARYSKAKVIAVSDKINYVKKDDIIYYDKHAGHAIEYDKELYTVIKNTDVIYIL
jgi:co-chaperonin GroES (HSP10)